MSAPTEEFDRPCPHGGSFVTCNDCLTETVAVDRWAEGDDE